jgi:putative chitobiose transport system permease protein
MAKAHSTPMQLSGLIGNVLYGFCLLVLLLAAVGPFIWLLLTALKSGSENIFDTSQWLPQQPTLENFVAVWQQVPMATYFINSIAVTVLAVGLNTVLSLLVAYPLARLDFKGKPLAFAIVLASMMIPFQVILIPLYQLMLHWGLTDYTSTAGWWSPLNIWFGLAIPVAVSGFGMVFLRQALVSLPKSLEEAAMLDGCNTLQLLWYVVVPAIQPAIATLAIFTLMASWGEFLWPSIVLSYEEHYTLPVGLVALQSAFSSNWRLVAAGTLLSMVPMLVVFVAFQRFFVKGLNAGAVKG